MNSVTDLKDRIKSRVTKDLAEIEDALVRNLNPHDDLVRDIAGHVLFAGGKRLRPLLMVLSARLCGYDGDDDKNISVLFEYLHAATLIHDDLVDEAVLRRGKDAAHLRYGNARAVLTGDFLLARSLSLAARTGIPKVIGIIAGITEDMSQGEIRQLTNKGRLDLTEAEYMDVIERKTAVLIRGACRTGALMAGADEEKDRALTDYGYHLGMAFQMADDLLDYTADTLSLGKTIGADLKEGKLTLPIIYALANASEAEKMYIEGMMGKEGVTAQEFRQFTETLERLGGLAYTRNMALAAVARAKNALSMFETGETRDLLSMLADYAMVRQS